MTLPLVANESADALAGVLAGMCMTRVRGAKATMQLKASNAEMAPLIRAIMRVEAELLLIDAELVDADHQDRRTSDQRRFDAFALIVYRVARARGTMPRAKAEAEIARWLDNRGAG